MSTRHPKFESIVSFARKRIDDGTWKPGARVPSENALSERFGVSRMTARRALDQLALDGHVVRHRGLGSFIADNGVRSSFLVIRNVADEISAGGRTYGSRVLRQCALRCNAEVAAALGLERGATVYHPLMVHLANDEAVQLEYRFVHPDGAPGYLEADLTLETPNHYLQRACPLAEARQDISAAMPGARQCQLLGIPRTQPCLVITRTTASRRSLVSFARILAPASRYRLSGRLHFTNRIGKWRH